MLFLLEHPSFNFSQALSCHFRKEAELPMSQDAEDASDIFPHSEDTGDIFPDSEDARDTFPDSEDARDIFPDSGHRGHLPRL